MGETPSTSHSVLLELQCTAEDEEEDTFFLFLFVLPILRPLEDTVDDDAAAADDDDDDEQSEISRQSSSLSGSLSHVTGFAGLESIVM